MQHVLDNGKPEISRALQPITAGIQGISDVYLGYLLIGLLRKS